MDNSDNVLRLKDLENAKNKLKEIGDKNNILPFNGKMITYIKPLFFPKLKLHENCPVTEKFREDFNQWLANTFGFKKIDIIPDNVAFVLNDDSIIMNETSFNMAKKLSNPKFEKNLY